MTNMGFMKITEHNTPEDCLLMNRLVRMNQHDSNGNLKLCTINDINDDIEMLSVF